MLTRHKNAIEQNDRLNWLDRHQQNMTDGEHEHFWECLRTYLEAEIELDHLYDAVKKRVGE